MRCSIIVAALVAALTVVGFANSVEASPVNLVTDGGFEDPSDAFPPKGWNVTRAASGSDVALVLNPLAAHSGQNTFQFAATGGLDDAISQSIQTVVGHRYNVQFWVLSSGGHPSDLFADFGDVIVRSACIFRRDHMRGQQRGNHRPRPAMGCVTNGFQ